jgi:hypothetical protein
MQEIYDKKKIKVDVKNIEKNFFIFFFFFIKKKKLMTKTGKKKKKNFFSIFLKFL